MFLLGFYISAVVKRWWEQFTWLAWPDDCLSMICYVMPGDDAEAINRRLTVARYLNLAAALSWREISVKVRKRFPSTNHLVQSGLMTSDEHKRYESTNPNCQWFAPLQWAQNIIREYCHKEQVPAPVVTNLLNLLYNYRTGFRQLHCYDWVCIPLVYTQVAAIATYGYFLLCLIGRQFLVIPLSANITSTEHRDHCIRGTGCVDYIVPFFTILEFLCYIGWFKVGQDLMRPFEEDDDDFELNYILDRNIQVSTSMVTEMYGERPQPPAEGGKKVSLLPHTRASARLKDHPPKLHAYVSIRKDSEMTLTDTSGEDQPCGRLRGRKRRKGRTRYF